MFNFCYVLYLTLFIDGSALAAKKETIINQCPAGQHWVKSYYQPAYARSDGTPYSGSNHRAGCRNNPTSYAIWNVRLKSGLPPKWENKKEKSKPWSDDEKEKVLEALDELPPQLLLNTIQGIYRLAKSTDAELNPGASHNTEIVLYDTAFKKGNNLTRVIAHEFAHRLYRQEYDTGKWKDYAFVAQWKPFKNPKSHTAALLPGRLDWVEEDGVLSVDEDFSNNIEYFLFNPKVLREKNQKIYDWIKNKYGDKFILGKGAKK